MVRPRHHALTLDEVDDASSVETTLAVAGRSDLKPERARTIMAEVGAAVLGWRDLAAEHSLTKAQVDRMARAFEREDLARAVG